MPALIQRLRLLRSAPTRALIGIVGPALAHAEPAERPDLVRSLLQTRDSEAVATAARHLHRLDPATRSEVIHAEVDHRRVLRHLAQQTGRTTRFNIIAYVHDRLDPRLVDFLHAGLGASDDETPARAAAALRALVVHAVADGCRPAREVANPLDQAVTHALEHWERHRQPAILHAAAMLAAFPGPKLRAFVEQSDHPAMFALRRVVGGLADEPLRSRALRWLSLPALARPVTRRLHEIRDPDAVGDILGEDHLIRTPSRRRALRTVSRAIRCLPEIADLTQMSAAVQAAIPSYVRALPVSPSFRIRTLADLIAAPAPLARLHAVTELDREASNAAREAVALFARDRQGVIARIAACSVADRSRRSVDAATLTRLARNPDAIVATLARRRLALSDVASFFSIWLEMPSVDRIAAALEVRAGHLDVFDAALIDALDNPAQTLAAIALARRLNIVPVVENRLRGCLSDPDVRIASAAIAALRDGVEPASLATIGRGLDHPDGRVSANAVETWLWRAPGALDRIEPKIDSPLNRVRANAIRGIIAGGHDAGEDALHQMLDDPEPRHRVSGIWVARRGRVIDMLAHLRAVAARDPSEDVRRRAAAAVHSLSWFAPTGRRVEESVR